MKQTDHREEKKKGIESDAGFSSTFSVRCTAQPNVTEPFVEDEGCTRQLPKINTDYRDDR